MLGKRTADQALLPTTNTHPAKRTPSDDDDQKSSWMPQIISDLTKYIGTQFTRHLFQGRTPNISQAWVLMATNLSRQVLETHPELRDEMPTDLLSMVEVLVVEVISLLALSAPIAKGHPRLSFWIPRVQQILDNTYLIKHLRIVRMGLV